jgi:SOS-response transcriptional repressor LexA
MTPSSTTEDVLQYIRHSIEEHGWSPTIREIASGCFISVGSVIRHLDRLEARGRIIRELGQARSIRLVEDQGEEL